MEHLINIIKYIFNKCNKVTIDKGCNTDEIKNICNISYKLTYKDILMKNIDITKPIINNSQKEISINTNICSYKYNKLVRLHTITQK